MFHHRQMLQLRRDDGTSSTLLRKRPTTSRSSDAFVKPNLILGSADSVAFLQTVEAEGTQFALVETSSGAMGYVQSKYLVAIAQAPDTTDMASASFIEPVSSANAGSKPNNLRILSQTDKEFRRLVEDGGVFYVLPHGTEYKIEATNPFLNLKATAEITVDGHVVGRWILKPNQTFAFDRPASVAKKFTFVRIKLAREADAALARKMQGLSLSKEEQEALKIAPADSGIQSGREENGVVNIKYTPEKMPLLMKIYVKTLTGETYVLSAVSPSDTVEHIKDRISLESGTPPEDQRLIYGGEQIEEGRTLADYRIQNEATVHHVRRLRGGGEGPTPAEAQSKVAADARSLAAAEARVAAKAMAAAEATVKKAAGGTTLHGASDQKFGEVQSFNSYKSKAVGYSVRLVADYHEEVSSRSWGQCMHLSEAGAAQEEI